MRRLLPLAGLLAACGVTPLTNRIAAGEEPFVIAVGEGPDRHTDLFAASAGGGSFLQLTFTRAEERAPRLSPDGTRVAYFRRDTQPGDTAWSIVVLDLRSGTERRLPPNAGRRSERLGWAPDGRAVVAGAAADSATREWLGSPASAWVEPCGDGGLCVITRDGERTPLGEGVTEAVRWGGDSVALGGPAGWEVRPLRGGRSRRPAWQGVPAGLRNLTYHPGTAGTAAGGPSGIR